MQNRSLTELRDEYACGKMDRKILEGLLFQYLLDNYERYRLFNGNRDKWVDFIGWLYPRLSRAIDLYRETGSTFDTYISSIVKWSSKEYKIREADHATTELACWKARAEEMELRSPEPGYPGTDDNEPWTHDGTGIIFPLRNMTQKQILLLLLKSYYFITPEFLKKASETIGMDEKEIQSMIDKIHELRTKKEERIHMCQERIYSQYYRCLAFQKRLSTALPGTAKYEKLKNYTDRARRKYVTMKQRLGKMHIDATNQQIALVLNVPKGTVDSMLHGIREKWIYTVKQPVMKIPVAPESREGYYGICSATGTVSMQEMPQMS